MFLRQILVRLNGITTLKREYDKAINASKLLDLTFHIIPIFWTCFSTIIFKPFFDPSDLTR